MEKIRRTFRGQPQIVYIENRILQLRGKGGGSQRREGSQCRTAAPGRKRHAFHECLLIWRYCKLFYVYFP